jgi:hypothetical protein
MKTSQFVLPLLAAMAGIHNANAQITEFGSPGGAPAGVNYVNFDNLPIGLAPATATSPAVGPGSPSFVTITFAPGSRIENTTLPGAYVTPFLSGSNGHGFGSPDQPDGVDTSPYLVANDLGRGITISFGGIGQKYLGLLWGTIDTYNTLTFNDVFGQPIQSFTGYDIVAAPVGQNDIDYVEFTDSNGLFYSVTMTSGTAFEFDNLSYSVNVPQVPPSPVPDGGATLPFACVLLAFAIGKQLPLWIDPARPRKVCRTLATADDRSPAKAWIFAHPCH